MERIPEPEILMADAEQAAAYAAADFSDANGRFVELFDRLNLLKPIKSPIIDLGCGPADICLRLARRYPDLHIDAVDGAQAMLDLARQDLEREPKLAHRIHLMLEEMPTANLPASHYGAVISNSLLHHLSDPQDLWLTLLNCAKPGAAVLIMDLMRPPGAVAVDSLVELHAMEESEILRRDFRASLYAAYRVDEVKRQLREAGIRGLKVRALTDRHLVVLGWLRS